MTWNDVLFKIIDAIVGIVISAGVPYLFMLLNKRINNDKVERYMDLAERYVIEAVAMVNQTFVDCLKAEGKFDSAAQKEAFSIAKENWIQMMGKEMKSVIVNEVGDIEAWLTTKIESAVLANK